jgi:hypothetical protein
MEGVQAERTQNDVWTSYFSTGSDGRMGKWNNELHNL